VRGVEEVGKEEKMCGMDPPIMETHLLVTSMLPVMAVSSHLSMVLCPWMGADSMLLVNLQAQGLSQIIFVI